LNKKNIFTGLIFILIGIWFYSALSSFKIEEGSDPKKIIIREGVVRTEAEIAKALSDEMGFDLEGAYKTGYTSIDVVEYLMKEPHERSFVLHEGRFYESRITVWRLLPLSVCIILIFVGAVIIIFAGRTKKS
jgi:hypothetical protein